MSDTTDWDNHVMNPRFMENLAKSYITRHGDGAHLIAVEKLLEAQEKKDEVLEKIYKDILSELDKFNKSEV